MTDRELELRRRHRDDFTYYSPRCLTIRPKAGSEVRMALNKAQRYIHDRIEAQRRELGYVRAIILKGRQQGASTYVEGRFYWRVSHRKGVKAFIIAHLDKASNNLFDMAKLYHEKCPEMLKPQTSASNGKILKFGALNSQYEIATAKNGETGRSGTYQYFHGSEVAFWPEPEIGEDGETKSDILGGALQGVADAPGTEVILESTANGKRGVFWEKVKQALLDDAREAKGEPRESEYMLIFVPWFWQEEYRKKAPRGFELSADEQAYMDEHSLDIEQMAWRRTKIADTSRGTFKREYPATPEEAFEAEVVGALWTTEMLEHVSPHDISLADMRRIVTAVDPSGGHKTGNDAQGIVTAGEGRDGIYYVWEDASCKKDPDGWGRETIGSYDRHKADLIVAEKNYGGEMVEHTLRTIRPGIPYKHVDATRGKRQRAEPIAALYKQGKVKHVGRHPELENELVTWVPDVSKWSPNRLDALVWAITELDTGYHPPPAVELIGIEAAPAYEY